LSVIAVAGLHAASTLFCVRALGNAGYDSYGLGEAGAVPALAASPPDLLIVSDDLDRHDWQDLVRAGRVARVDMRLMIISFKDRPASPYVLPAPFSLRQLKDRAGEVLALPPAGLP